LQNDAQDEPVTQVSESLRSAGISEEAIPGMTDQVMTLSADVATFENVPVAQAIQELTEAPATEKAVAPPAPPEPEDIGDMTREELAAFVVDIITQVNGKSAAAASKKEADNEQALADALEMVKGLSTRVQAAEKSATELQQALQELTDARPVGIKQLSERRPTASADNLTATVPTGPHMDESFVNFLQGGK
jgi:flagellar motility protein MotE (MotC chaperone)